jgi:FkbM family methyltransferase
MNLYSDFWRGFYSGLGQDMWVLNTAKNKYFVDIGAADGFGHSNSLKLEMEGWNGICVEPVPSLYEILNQCRRCIKINKAAWRENTTIDFLICNGPGLSGIPGYFDNIHHRDGSYNPIDTITLNQLLKENNAPKDMGYLSIDTEGTEYEILKAFDFSYTFDCMTIEHNFDSQKKNNINTLLTSNGYKLCKEVEQDDFYIHERIK